MAGDARGRVFTFPIPTYNITPDFPWESDNAERLFALTAKYGLPYFQNFLNSELKPNMIRSMCCRLQLDLTELLVDGCLNRRIVGVEGRSDVIAPAVSELWRLPGTVS